MPKTSSFALTFNPLNLVIGRYGLNLEYQPIPHHGLIVTPHYDNASASKMGDYGYAYKDTVTGGGAELGYRLYSGKHGFDGFFAGPSLIIGRHKLTTENAVSPPPEGDMSRSIAFTSVGGALDIGWQWQPGQWIVGAGVGVQYTRLNTRLGKPGFPIYFAVADGWWPRAALIVGYAF